VASIANDALPILALFAPAFSPPTLARAQLLAVAVILTTGRRTVSNLLRTVAHLTQGASSSYHRVLSSAHFSGLQLAQLLLAFLIHRFFPTGTILLVGDDTVCEHPGAKVYGKARHRDAVRSSHRYTAWRWGHKWVTLAVLVRFPFSGRPWALPVLTALYRSPQDNKARRRPHKTPAQLMQLLLRIVLRWFPDRQFRFAGDSGFGSHEMAHFAQKRKSRLALVSKFHPKANLYEAAPVVVGKKPNGRPRQKGAKMPSPAEVVASTARRTRLDVAWYGGSRREVEVLSAVGYWYKAGAGLVAVRWVYVRDKSGTHRDDYLYSTDVSLTAQEIIETYTQRWNIETTFEEMRAYLGLETTRGHCQKTVQRAEPMLLGMYSVVALLYEQLPAVAQEQGAVEWEGKKTVTFSDAISAVRRWLWTEWVFPQAGHEMAFAKLPLPLRQALLYALAPAA
jgi:DDE superfamily endonuclease/Archaeal putative transposase ISC1217